MATNGNGDGGAAAANVGNKANVNRPSSRTSRKTGRPPGRPPKPPTTSNGDLDTEQLERGLAHLKRLAPSNWEMRLGDVGLIIANYREALIIDLGGYDHVTAMQKVVIDIAARNHVILETIDQFMLNPDNQKIIDLDRGQARFIVMQRKAIADSQARYMQLLGFTRRRAPKRVDDIMREISAEADIPLERFDEIDRQTAEQARATSPSDALDAQSQTLEDRLAEEAELASIGLDANGREIPNTELDLSEIVADDEIVDDESTIEVNAQRGPDVLDKQESNEPEDSEGE